MRNSFLRMIFILLLASPSSVQPPPPPQPESYKLVLQWPVSFCNTNERLSDPCYQVYLLEFSIHGLWGYDKLGNSIMCHQHPNMVQMKTMSSKLLNDMKNSWRNHLMTRKYNELWKHEWITHGSCLNTFKTSTEYFTLATNVMEKIWKNFGKKELHEVFASEGLVPSGIPYDFQRFAKTIEIKSQNHLVVELRCNNDANRALQLYEIIFCVNLQGELKNCTFYAHGCYANLINYPEAPQPPPQTCPASTSYIP
ncbi:ribonuclease 1-like [Actinidia eriantha]|uniref:ribonuclease 1-like n=1 Tax=Actinidia eriantha TaxID=165200 RepID=UPI0025844CBC|nr:ribonuclease 1-like [Actinidia eriantha]